MVQTRKLCKVAMRLSSRAPVRDLKLIVFNGLRESPAETRVFVGGLSLAKSPVARNKFRRTESKF